MKAYLWAKKERLEEALSGRLAARYGGPWSPPGLPAVYAALEPGAAALELLIHLNADPSALKAFGLYTLELPDEPVAVHVGFDRPWEVGQAFLLAGRRYALKVPSRAVPGAWNLLINPRHPAFSERKIRPEPERPPLFKR